MDENILEGNLEVIQIRKTLSLDFFEIGDSQIKYIIKIKTSINKYLSLSFLSLDLLSYKHDELSFCVIYLNLELSLFNFIILAFKYGLFLHFKRADLVDVGFDSFEVNEVGLRVV